MAESTSRQIELSAEEQRLYERLQEAFDDECRRLARVLASKADRELFGETEYQVRDAVHRLGAKALETAADERQKKGGIRRC